MAKAPRRAKKKVVRKKVTKKKVVGNYQLKRARKELSRAFEKLGRALVRRGAK